MMLDESEASDAELIGRAKVGDRGAFGKLLERHYDFVYRAAYRWCGKKADAEDIAQEVCVRLGKAIRDYRGGGAFTTWLYSVTMNAARDMMRKTTRENVKTEAYGAYSMISGEASAEPEDPTIAIHRLLCLLETVVDQQAYLIEEMMEPEAHGHINPIP